jgi:hypothetical protein
LKTIAAKAAAVGRCNQQHPQAALNHRPESGGVHTTAQAGAGALLGLIHQRKHWVLSRLDDLAELRQCALELPQLAAAQEAGGIQTAGHHQALHRNQQQKAEGCCCGPGAEGRQASLQPDVLRMDEGGEVKQAENQHRHQAAINQESTEPPLPIMIQQLRRQQTQQPSG